MDYQTLLIAWSSELSSDHVMEDVCMHTVMMDVTAEKKKADDRVLSCYLSWHPIRTI